MWDFLTIATYCLGVAFSGFIFYLAYKGKL